MKRAPNANPADLSLEDLINIQVDVVFAASKYEQKVTHAPASVSIATAEEFKRFGYRNLADLLRSLRSFYVSYDRQYSYLGSRGFQRPGDFNSRYLILIDGHRMNDNIFDASSFANDGFLDLDLVDRVEVIRGPSSSIYGNNAFLGVINIVTRTGHQFDGGESSMEAGSFGTYKGRFSFGRKFPGGLELLLSASYFTSRGQSRLYYSEFDQRISLDPRAQQDGVARDSDAEETRQLFVSAAWHDVTLTALYGFRVKDVPTAPFGTVFGRDVSHHQDERKYVELKYNRPVGETGVSARLSYDAFPHIGKFPYDYGSTRRLEDIVNDYDGNFGEWATGDVQFTRKVLQNHTVIVGGEYRENFTQHLFNYDAENTTFIEDRRQGRSFGAFGQAEIILHAALRFNAGVRYDHFDTFGGTTNPRMGLIYNPWEKTTFKLLYGQAFRAPNDYELYYGAAGFGQLPNPELKPETIRTYELIYEQYLPGNLRFSASGYYYAIDNLISQVFDPELAALIFNNVQEVQAQGMEFEVEGKYPFGVLARGSYTVQKTRHSDTGQELTNSPRHAIKGNLSVPLFQRKIFAGLEFQYQSAVTLISTRRSPGFVTGNLTFFSKSVVKGAEFSVSVYNLFDRQYVSPASGANLQDAIPQDGRSFRLKLTYGF